MKEYQRKIAIEQILETIAEKKLLTSKQKILEGFKSNPTILAVDYFRFEKEIEELEEKYKYCNTEEKIIESVFRRLMNEDFRCHHETWIYEGSYYLSIDKFRYEHDHLCKGLDESLPTIEGDFEFKHNSYICLECGQKIEVKDWENFERNHFVLKSQNDDLDINKYISLYYQSLYKMPAEEAKEKVIQAFNIEKSKGITKTLKK